ncbi:interferon-induced 35 kDa protein [Maylandia zebra]|uniref:Interferon-induced protein 35 n=2 Tax=Haplochromini TaxID=319058 RepID=A0A3P9AYN1_9CICH|nr:interferon-induced 35 kDa protein [Maylandia zebra]XP_026019891.1 interferon-induced 35 kDa protein [Astatotilapia calliptera]
MSSDEDFSLVPDSQSEDTLEGIKASIKNYKKKYDQLMEETKELTKTIQDRRDLKQQFKHRTDKLTQDLEADKRSYGDQLANEKSKLDLLKQEELKLVAEIKETNAAIKEEEANKKHLMQQADVFTSVPERDMVFKGATGNANNKQEFEMKPHIVYPMDGGTALITFEEEVVARKILELKKHQVDLGGECSITVEARPVHLMLPKLVEIDSEVSSQRILISNLPRMETETLVDKLEIHFSKTKNGGGEVADCEYLSDSETVVLTFAENIAKRVVQNEFHDLSVQKKKHTVRVTPFLNGKISNLKTKMTQCPRAVMLTGIPDIMERETLQDLLEIHFQKNTNGGGEIEAFLYNPLGEHTSAVFGGVTPDSEDEEQ